MDFSQKIYLDNWSDIGRIIAYVLFNVGVVVWLYHFIRLTAIKNYKAKYDYITEKENNFIWRGSLFLILGAAFFCSTLTEGDEGGIELLWFIIMIFAIIMFGLIAGLIVFNVLKFYYPFYVEKRLRKLRYTPRISPKTGKPMKLLSEEEEDVHLDEGMQVEEDVFSVDYDVWVDEESGYTQIEKYSGHLHALKCPECSYQTLKVSKEEIIESPTTSTEGELVKFFLCGYCGYKARKSFIIAPLKESDSENNDSIRSGG